MIGYQCPRCGQRLQSANDATGKVVACPGCRQAMRVPALPSTIPTVLRVTPSSPELPGSSPAPQPPARVASSWWQPVSPCFMVLVLGMFFLPWVEIRCDAGPMEGKTIGDQSGFQAVQGIVTKRFAMDNREQEIERKAKQLQSSDRKKAPLLALYPFLLLGGILASLAVKRDDWRRPAVASCAAVALMVVLGQAFVGLPLAQQWGDSQDVIREDMERSRSQDEFGFKALGAGMIMAIEAHRTPWFWVAVLAKLAALVAPLAEERLCGQWAGWTSTMTALAVAFALGFVCVAGLGTGAWPSTSNPTQGPWSDVPTASRPQAPPKEKEMTNEQAEEIWKAVLEGTSKDE